MNYTHAYSVYPVKCALDPFTPRNEGTYRAIEVAAPEGSILNPRFPAPVSARQLTGHLLAGAIYQALAAVVPDRVIAECGGAPTMRALFSGVDRNGDRFSQILFAIGRHGGLARTATGCRPPLSRPTLAPAASRRSRASRRWSSGAKQLRPDIGGPGRSAAASGRKR